MCHGPTCALAGVCQSEIMIAKLGCFRHHMEDPPIMDDPIHSYLVVISQDDMCKVKSKCLSTRQKVKSKVLFLKEGCGGRVEVGPGHVTEHQVEVVPDVLLA